MTVFRVWCTSRPTPLRVCCSSGASDFKIRIVATTPSRGRDLLQGCSNLELLLRAAFLLESMTTS